MGIKIEKPSNYVLLSASNVEQIKKEISGFYNYCENSRFAIEQAFSNSNMQVLINTDNLNETITFGKLPYYEINAENINKIKEKIQQECYIPQNASIKILDTREGEIKDGKYVTILFKINTINLDYYAELYYINYSNSTYAVSFNSIDKSLNSNEIIKSFENIYSLAYDQIINEAISFYKNKDYNNALLKLSEAIKLDPKNSSAYEKRISINLERSNYQEAINDANKVLKFDPTNIDVIHFKALALSSLERYQEAIDNYILADAMIVLLSSSNAQNEYYFSTDEIYIMKGDAYQMMNQLDNALEAYYNAISISDNDYPKATAYFKVAQIKSTYQNNYQDAIEDYTNAIEFYSDNIAEEKAFAFFNRGVNLNKVGENKRAFQDFSSAIKLRPDYSRAYLQRGLTRCLLEDFKGCKEDADKFLNIDKSNIELKGKAYFMRGMSNLILLNDFTIGCKDIREAKKLGEKIPKEFSEACF